MNRISDNISQIYSLFDFGNKLLPKYTVSDIANKNATIISKNPIFFIW